MTLIVEPCGRGRRELQGLCPAPGGQEDLRARQLPGGGMEDVSRLLEGPSHGVDVRQRRSGAPAPGQAEGRRAVQQRRHVVVRLRGERTPRKRGRTVCCARSQRRLRAMEQGIPFQVVTRAGGLLHRRL